MKNLAYTYKLRGKKRINPFVKYTRVIIGRVLKIHREYYPRH